MLSEMMDMKTILEYLMGSNVITDLKYFCLSIQWNLFTKYPNKIQEADPTHDTCP